MDKMSLLDLLVKITKNQATVEEIKDGILNKQNMDYLFKEVLKNKLVAIFYYTLADNNMLMEIPKYYRSSLINQMVAAGLSYQFYQNEFKRINELLQDNSIDFAFIKGISLCKRYYSKIGRFYRGFGDIDILVNIKDISKVKELIELVGYKQGKYEHSSGRFIQASRSEEIYWQMTSHQMHEFVKKYEGSYYCSGDYLSVDINKSIFFGGKYKDPIPGNVLLKNVNYITDDEYKFPVLEKNYELIQLCYSLYKDTVYINKKNDEGLCLINLLDIYLFLKNEDIDMKNVICIARNAGIENEICQSLYTVNEVYCVPELDNYFKNIDCGTMKKNLFYTSKLE